MTNLQSPQILTDLYRDLRDRRLLPLIVVLLVGMVVVPIALSKSPQPPALAPPLPPAPASAKSNAPSEQVVVANPGLRDYKKRLQGASAKDPFVQEFTAPLTAAADSGAAAGSSAPSSAGTGTSTTTGPTSSGGGTTTTTTQQVQTQSKYYFYRVKLRAGKLGDGLKVYESVGTLAPIPGKKVPTATFLGVTKDSSFNAKTAVFLVSSAVSSAEGDGHCTFVGSQCQLLSLKPGEHEDLVWIDGSVYRIELLKFDLVARNQLPGVGSSNGGGGSGGGGNRYFSF